MVPWLDRLIFRTPLNPNRSLGRICYVIYYYLLPFVFYKASNACFLLEIARYYSQKQQATSALLKIQNATSPNDRIGLNETATRMVSERRSFADTFTRFITLISNTQKQNYETSFKVSIECRCK